jgi:extracellular elastinolytic metalloproteinase
LLGTDKQRSSPSSRPSDYIYTQDPNQDPTTPVNLDAARVNAFYIVNSIHDISYRYGFTEKAFNFQNDNFGKGGAGNDRVTISVQDSAGTDNANFATPPEYVHFFPTHDHCLHGLNIHLVANLDT